MDPNDQGRYFELGRAYLEGETRAAGWQQQVPLGRDGKRILDSAKVNARGEIEQSRERKSGRVDRTAVGQIQKELRALRDGTLGSSRWETVEGAQIPREVQAALDMARREFPDRFEHRIISRAEAMLAIREGQRLAAKQRELDGLERTTLRERHKQYLRQRTLEREKAVRERAERDKAARERTAQENKARDRAGRLSTTYQRFRDGAERGFDRVADAHSRSDSLTDAYQRFREAAERGREEATRRAREREASEREATRIREARAAHERTLQRLPRDVADALRRSFPVPGDEWLHGLPPHHSSTRAGREERARARERGRDGRERGR